METKFQTSFIPKQPVTDTELHRGSGASLFFLFSFILFMASLASAGGTTVTSKSIVGKKRVTVIKNKRSVTVNTFKQCNNGKDIYGR
jgi:hypothetical protein